MTAALHANSSLSFPGEFLPHQNQQREAAEDIGQAHQDSHRERHPFQQEQHRRAAGDQQDGEDRYRSLLPFAPEGRFGRGYLWDVTPHTYLSTGASFKSTIRSAAIFSRSVRTTPSFTFVGIYTLARAWNNTPPSIGALRRSDSSSSTFTP
jgi:hypothetical protein